jgi:hypothetical protein
MSKDGTIRANCSLSICRPSELVAFSRLVTAVILRAAAKGEWRRSRSANSNAEGRTCSCGTTLLISPMSQARSGVKRAGHFVHKGSPIAA